MTIKEPEELSVQEIQNKIYELESKIMIAHQHSSNHLDMLKFYKQELEQELKAREARKIIEGEKRSQNLTKDPLSEKEDEQQK